MVIVGAIGHRQLFMQGAKIVDAWIAVVTVVTFMLAPASSTYFVGGTNLFQNGIANDASAAALLARLRCARNVYRHSFKRCQRDASVIHRISDASHRYDVLR